MAGALRAKEKNVRATFVPARALIAKALAALVLAAPAAAQTANPPPVSSGTSSPSELTARFVASAIPTTNFIALGSRLASGSTCQGSDGGRPVPSSPSAPPIRESSGRAPPS